MRTLKYLVMDEADRLLDLDFGPILDKILKVLPREGRHTYLFSATMWSKVESLQRASLQNPFRVSGLDFLSPNSRQPPPIFHPDSTQRQRSLPHPHPLRPSLRTHSHRVHSYCKRNTVFLTCFALSIYQLSQSTANFRSQHH